MIYNDSDRQMDLKYLQNKLTETLNKAGTEGENLEVTELCYDILTQDPNLHKNIANTGTLTGESLDTLNIEDRFYIGTPEKSWLFSLHNIAEWVADHSTNPYTQARLDDRTIASIKRRHLAIKHTPPTPAPASAPSPASSPSPCAAPSLDMRRSSSFNVPHKVTEFLQTVSHLGFYPDVNGFTELDWTDILHFVQDLLTNWEGLSELLNPEEKERLEHLSDFSEVSEDDKKMIVLFLLRTVTQGDGDDERRALLFTTELAHYLDPTLERAHQDPDIEVDEGMSVMEVDWESLLSASNPDEQTFLRSVRYIIEHIVNMNTYSLSEASEVSEVSEESE